MTDDSNNAANDYAMASAVARYVDLSEVRLTETSVKMIGTRDGVVRAAPWAISLKRDMRASLDEKVLSVEAVLSIEVASANTADNSTDKFICSCTYILIYQFNVRGGPEGEQLQAHLNAFANVNGLYNVWPYFRELVQSFSGRVGIPPVVLPVYRVPRPSVAGGSTSSVASTAPSAQPPDQKEQRPVRKALKKKASRRSS